MIAYKGAGPALNDLMAGQVQLMVDPMLSSLPLAQGKAIKALAVTSAKRLASAPEIPTVAESGMTGFEFVSWYGLWAPKNLPPALVEKLQAEVAKIVAQPEVKQCPVCGHALTNVPSNNKPVPHSHTYECQGCSRRFEINVL